MVTENILSNTLLYSTLTSSYERPVGIFQHHEFTVSASRIQLRESTISASRNHKFNFMNSRLQLHEFTILTS
jgi:hypothetical protein